MAARTLANQQLEITPAGVTLATLFPDKFRPCRRSAAKIHPKLWDPVLLTILYAPTALILAVIGFSLLALTRPRREPTRSARGAELSRQALRNSEQGACE